MDEDVLRSDLVAGVLPKWVPQRRRLGDREPGHRFGVGGSCGDEHKLPGAPSEGVDVVGDVGGGERHEVDHAVERSTADGRPQGVCVTGVRDDHLGAVRHRMAAPAPPVHQGDPVPPGEGLSGDRMRDRTRSADDQNIHGESPKSVQKIGPADKRTAPATLTGAVRLMTGRAGSVGGCSVEVGAELGLLGFVLVADLLEELVGQRVLPEDQHGDDRANGGQQTDGELDRDDG